MRIEQAKPSTISVVIQSANPIFIILVMGLPVGSLIYALNFGSLTSLNFVHM